MYVRIIALLLLTALLASCGGGEGGGGYYEDDGPPKEKRVPEWVKRTPDAVPRHESIYSPSLKAYRVGMRTYRPMRTSRGYRKVGIASWYGKKFHGRKTSNGERYNMYDMTAAHRTLPLPSYVRVTNLRNHRSVVVRVNDRGPFRKDRIIDLSYAAALKLGIVGKGTGKVEVTALQPGEVSPPVTARAEPAPTLATPRKSASTQTSQRAYVQVGAFGNWHNANALKAKLTLRDLGPVVLWHSQTVNGSLYRVLIGPFKEPAKADSIKTQVAQLDLGNPKIVTE